jgi:hypothetical protein
MTLDESPLLGVSRALYYGTQGCEPLKSAARILPRGRERKRASD